MKYVVVTSCFSKDQNDLIVRSEIVDTNDENARLYGCSSCHEVAMAVEAFWNISPYSPLVKVIAVTHLEEDWKAEAYLIHNFDLKRLYEHRDEKRDMKRLDEKIRDELREQQDQSTRKKLIDNGSIKPRLTLVEKIEEAV